MLFLLQNTDIIHEDFIQKYTGNAAPLQTWRDAYCCRRLRLPEFIENWHMKVERLLALSTGGL